MWIPLAVQSLSFGGIEPFFERVIQQKLLEHNEFAFYLNVDSTKPSALLWGGIDQSLYEGPLRMFPVVQAGADGAAAAGLLPHCSSFELTLATS
ncbi:unnamed protein product [Prorocentrum cordatum]|uniref:Peptidase A1 domain-containing protein n=1 Tax=Prorocentrum cordatum TaxID=2364126 RepID=A0ABN9RD28_9DINO|nr:unnamed protein product [Polarella glacialis]